VKLTRSENLPAVEKLTDSSSLAIAVLAAVYFIAAKLASGLAYHDLPNAIPVWPSAGIALAALLLRGNAVWPGILLGAFSANLVTTGSIFASLAIAGGNTAEALVGAWLVRRFARGPEAMDRTRDVLKFLLFAGLLSTTISATVGALSLAWRGLIEWNSCGWMWLVWWMGDATGDVLVAPLILLWRGGPRLNWRRFIEVSVLVVGVVAMGAMVFGGLMKDYPLEFFCIPFLVWAAFRFGRRGAIASTLALAAMAIWGTLKGSGPFALASEVSAYGVLLLLQSFLVVSGVMTLALAAEVRQRRRAEREARSLAVSDPVTGLGNYRRLVDSLESEIKRAERTQRPFAFVLLDLDDLKKLNDIYGHLVGTRALCRLADIVRLHSRSIDTVARYGGDEFAVILPETDRIGGSQVAARIASLLAEDGEQPSVSVSFGVAMWPDNGRTTEALFHAADNALYEMKRGRGGVHAIV
jgi:diguanylate cyclase (GGDEF)-like protein